MKSNLLFRFTKVLSCYAHILASIETLLITIIENGGFTEGGEILDQCIVVTQFRHWLPMSKVEDKR